MEVTGVYDELVEDGIIVEHKSADYKACRDELIIDIVDYVVTPATDDTPAVTLSVEGINLGTTEHHWENGDVLDRSQTVVYDLATYGQYIGDNDFVNVPINCQDDSGKAFTYCADCGDRILIKVKGGHTKGDEPVKEADHTTAAVYKCTVEECGAYFFDGTPVDHKFVWDKDNVGNKMPEVGVKGNAVFKCECGETLNVELPALDAVDDTTKEPLWKAETTNSCETGDFTTYTLIGGLKVDPEEFTYTYTENSANISAKYDQPATTVNFSFSTDPEDVGKHQDATTATIFYQWIEPETADGETYIGYICKDCGHMIVLASGEECEDFELPNTEGTLIVLKSLKDLGDIDVEEPVDPDGETETA